MGPKQPFDAFLPSGAVGDARSPFNYAALISPRGLLPDYIPQPLHQGGSRNSPSKSYPATQPLSYFQQRENAQSPGSLTPSQSHGPPISPPVSRSASSDGAANSSQIEYWRQHCRKIREQAEGERAHMMADRTRADEIMDEERALWDEERKFLNARIAELEARLDAIAGPQSFTLNGDAIPKRDTILHQSNGGTPQGAPPRPLFQTTNSNGGGGSLDGMSAMGVPQESGRNPDGSALWAPAPQNPSRTFETSESSNLKVDSMSAPRETPLRVTSRELRSSDFGVSTPPTEEHRVYSQEGSVVGEGSIDISHIQPDLEGIPLKTSAVAPEFVAMVMSPSSSLSPSKPASNAISPPRPRDITNMHDGLLRSPSQNRKTSTLEVIAAPENDRRTMHAGHTPNHSVTRFDLGESGSATPTQSHHVHNPPNVQHPTEEDGQLDGDLDEDPPLKGPLGLKNIPAKDERFLAAVTNKLNELRESGQLSPSEASVASDVSKASIIASRYDSSSSAEKKDNAAEDEEIDGSDAIDEAPRLRVRPSTNFGRPFGTL